MPIRVPTRVPIRVPGQAQTVCLVRRRPCAFALLRRDTQRVWGLGEPFYLDKLHVIALSKEAINKLINLHIIVGSFLDGVSGAPDDPFGGWIFHFFAFISGALERPYTSIKYM